MERSLGFGSVQPLLYREDKDPASVLDSNPDLVARVHARLERALGRGTDVILENRKAFDRLVREIFSAQALDGDAVNAILAAA